MTVDTVGVTAFDLAISSIPGLGFACGPPADTCIAGAQPPGMDFVLHNGQTAFAITDTVGATLTMINSPAFPEEFLQQFTWGPVGTDSGTWSATALTPAVPQPDSVYLLVFGFAALRILCARRPRVRRFVPKLWG